MRDQITQQIMMIRPAAFSKNKETSINNYFQVDTELTAALIQTNVLQEFDDFVQKLREASIEVRVFEDTQDPSTPDSIFPNNWVSFHQNGSVILYPMFANNRRLERRCDLIDALGSDFKITEVFEDLLSFESHHKFLEGTGSLVLDRVNQIAYASYSDRTEHEVILAFEKLTAYSVISFTAYQNVNGRRLPIYHTNVMMALGERFAIICLDSINKTSEKGFVVETLESTGKEVIEISMEQMNSFAGNMLQVRNDSSDTFLVMSDAAFNSLEESQIKKIEKYIIEIFMYMYKHIESSVLISVFLTYHHRMKVHCPLSAKSGPIQMLASSSSRIR